MKEDILNASSIVEEAYNVYAKHVNMNRALPSVRDGLKPVQRRILLALLISSDTNGSLISSSSIVGDTLKKFHPHGDSSIYSAMVKMVNDTVPYVKGKGNFGYKGMIEAGAAAARYTKVGLSPYLINNASPIFKYSETFTNENEYEEHLYIPSLIPYCLFNGAIGIGLGCLTRIPCFTSKSLFGIVEDLLSEKEVIRKAIPLNIDAKVDKDQIDLLNKSGYGSFTLKSKVEWIIHKDHGRTIQITEVPREVNLNNIKKVFSKELLEKLVTIQDISGENIKILIGRNKRVRKISDSDLEKKAIKATSKKVKYVCYVADDDDVARVLSPIDMIRKSVTLASKCFKQKLLEDKEKISNDILFQNKKHDLAKLLISGKEKEEIIKQLEISDSQYAIFSSKTISSLKTKKKDIQVMESNLQKITNDLSNINNSLLNAIWKPQ